MKQIDKVQLYLSARQYILSTHYGGGNWFTHKKYSHVSKAPQYILSTVKYIHITVSE